MRGAILSRLARVVLPALVVAALAYQAWAHRKATAQAEPKEFDPSVAQASAQKAAVIALANCGHRPGPDGPGQVELRFDPSGMASHVRVLPDALGASARGACIQSMFRLEAAVSAFRGESGTVAQVLHALPQRPEGAAYPRAVAPLPHDPRSFDFSAAGLSLARAARRVHEQCRPAPEDPVGEGRVLLEFGSDGAVKDVQLRDPQFQNTPTGACILELFEQVSVPSFAGESGSILKTFVVGDGPAPPVAFDYEAAAQALANDPPPFDVPAAERALKQAAERASECHQGDAWGWGEIQVDFSSYGRVDHAQLLSERFQATETGRCVANAFRGAQVPVFSGAGTGFIQEFEIEPTTNFDEVSATRSLADAASLATACKPKEGPRGPLEVGVRFDRDGSVKRALVMTPAFGGSLAKSCVEMVFRRARALPFDGPAPALVQEVVIE